jgi:hypothetical protein
VGFAQGECWLQYSNQITLDMVYHRLRMHYAFNQLDDDRGHHSINDMIEKSASLTKKFYNAIEEKDEIDTNGNDSSC